METTKPAMDAQTRVVYRTCPLCEATCGLEITLAGDRVERVRGDARDVFSRGFCCPKGVALGELHHDPDRLQRPMIRSGDSWTEVGWAAAFEAVEKGLTTVFEQFGRNAVSVYLGNPCAHTMAGCLYVRPLVKAVGSPNVFSASTVDQMPKHVSSGLLFGHTTSIPVPDVDRTDYLLMLGANPLVSNGSLATAPGFPERLRALRRRGGKLVVIDPRVTQTAKAADEHHFIRPGTDPLLLSAMAHVLFAEGLVNPGRLTPHIQGMDALENRVRSFSPETVSGAVGMAADVIRRLARELAQAQTAAVYGRMGMSTVAFGALGNTMVDVLNILTGNLDREGGAMFPYPAIAVVRTAPGGKGFEAGRWKSRVSGVGEVAGELPVAVMAEEMQTPGKGQIHALLTIAGNPVLTTTNSRRLDAAFQDLDFMVSVDYYLNETTRHADVILPPRSPLATGHYDLALYNMAVRNIANYSPPALEEPDLMDKWEILAKLALIASGQGAEAAPTVLDDFVFALMAGKTPKTAAAIPEGRKGPERLLDLMLRNGPYHLTLDDLLAHPHGLDLGPLKPRIPDILQTPSGRIEICPEPIREDLQRLASMLKEKPGEDRVVLIGRRHLRSNNSWMHNLPSLMTGKPRCTLLVHPVDARRFGLLDGGMARVSSGAGAVDVPVQVSGEIMPGVVSLPHGWGHDTAGTRLCVARQTPGVNSNILTEEDRFDPLSGTTVLNGIPVNIAPV